MKTAIAFLFLASASLAQAPRQEEAPFVAADALWIDDFEEASEIARKERKPLFIAFR